MTDEGPSRSVVHALERLASLRRIAADALREGDISRAQAALERAEHVERELQQMIGAPTPPSDD